MKKLIAIVLALVLCLSLFAGCNGNQGEQGGTDLAGTYDIKVWVAEAIVDLTKTQIENFNATNTDGIVINATVEPVGEGDAATAMTTDVEAGADIFCFAQDQTARLIQAGALNALGQAAGETVKSTNDPGSVGAVTSGDTLYAYPLTADNGFFMYYDKSVIKEEDIDSMDKLIAACEAAGRNFSFELENGWYIVSYFFATGCDSQWVTDNDGTFTSVEDTFNSDKGLIAAKGVQQLVTSSVYVNSSKTADFEAAVPSAVVVSGTWDYETAKNILGDNLGVADLPSFTVDGTEYHLASYNGCKLMGVKPQTDAKRGAALHKLAQYLTGEACQLERFDAMGWGPSNLAAQGNEKVKTSVHLTSLWAQNAYSKPQGQIHGSWWDIAKVIATNIRGGMDLQEALTTYENSMNALFNMSADELTAYTVIGSINGDGWTVDLPMTEQADGTWKTDEAYTMDAGVEFKCRQGKSWDVAYPADNFVVETAGTYYIVLDPVAGTVSLVEG